MPLTFGEVVIDSQKRLLTRDGKECHLSAKAFALLDLLLANRPNAVRREEIVDQIWPDTYVAASNVATLIQEIRDALSDDARCPRFVKTIFAYGYAFVGEETKPPAPGSPCLFIGAQPIILGQRETILGRENPLLSMDPSISRHHARILLEKGSAVIEDLASKNGTWVTGRRIDAPIRLVDGDVIEIGTTHLIFRDDPRALATVTLPGAAPDF